MFRRPTKRKRNQGVHPIRVAAAYALGMLMLGDHADDGEGRLINLVLLAGLAAALLFALGLLGAGIAGSLAAGLRRWR